jgi:pimeloyl-ACP methyl ester carboxylesterase
MATQTTRKTITQRRGCHYWFNLAAFTLCAILFACIFLQYLAHPFLLSYSWSHPQRLALNNATPKDVGLTYEDASFKTSDGLTLRGWYIPSQNKAAVILLHPVASNRMGVSELAKIFARQGYGVLLFDIRAHGESDGDVLPYGGPEAEDVRAAVNYLQTRTDLDPQHSGIMGPSLGAQISILGAARDPRIKAVVADAPCCTVASDWPPPQSFSEWLYVPYDAIFFPILDWRTGVTQPVAVRDAIAQIAPRPLLLIGSGDEARAMQHHFAAAREPKMLWIIPEAGHIEGLSIRPQEYEARIMKFFDEALRK